MVQSGSRGLLALRIAAIAAVLSAGPLSAQRTRGYKVIVHPDNSVEYVTRSELSGAFLKKSTRWKDGSAVRPVDLPSDSTVRRQFTRDVVGRTVAAVRFYWQRAIFSGRAVPPPELATDRDVVRYVARVEGAVGYVSPESPVGRARVIEVR